MKLQIALLASVVLAVSGCGGAGSEVKDLPTDTVTNNSDYETTDPSSSISDSSAFNDYGVHDPSVIKAGGTYYVVGSHLAMAKTTNLMTWEESPNPFVSWENYETEISEGVAWTDGYVGNWAGDIIESPDGSQYWFYYNHCGQDVSIDDPDNFPESEEQCWRRSYMGLAVSDSIEGPYLDQGIFLRSGQRAGEESFLPEGVDAYDGAVHPNAIDPAAFYDTEGGLWMVYGSHSGGIFVLEMDTATGMPIAGQGFGTKLLGGNYERNEGAFVMYSPESQYYYLFWSYGGFNAAEGYNIRMARSVNPQGPYFDAEGNDVVAARESNNMGVKLMGGFNFESLFADYSHEFGYRSPGHNSALYDEALGKHLLFTHTRFPEDQVPFTEYHAVRVHELWLNEDGWLVSSPQRYAPIDGDNLVSVDDIRGDYKFILHGDDTNTTVKSSVYVSLDQGPRLFSGVISGTELSGTYSFNEDDLEQVTFVVNDVTYKGVAKWQWNVVDETFLPVISAMSDSGEMLWGIQLLEYMPSEFAEEVLDTISIPDVVAGSRIEVPQIAARNATISWASDNIANVRVPENPDDEAESFFVGLVRPALGQSEAPVVLTATVKTANGARYSREYSFAVAPRVENNQLVHYTFDDVLSDSFSNRGDAHAIGNRPWLDGAVAYAEGVNGNAVSLDGTNGVRFPNDLITNYEYTVSYWMNPTVVANFTPSFFGAVDEFSTVNDLGETVYFADRWINVLPANWVGTATLWSHNVLPGIDNWFTGDSAIALTAGEWVHVAFAVDQGDAVFYLNGEVVAAGGNMPDFYTGRDNDAVFTMGVNYWDVPLIGMVDDLKIYDAALSSSEVRILDVEGNVASNADKLAAAVADLELGDLSTLIADINLPSAGSFASAISWQSSNSAFIDQYGFVTRGAEGTEPVEVTLTATISYAGLSETKTFTATVIPNGPPEIVAHYSFENNLDDSQGNFAAGYPIESTTFDGLMDPAGESESYSESGIVGSALSMTGAATVAVRFDGALIKDYDYAFAYWVNPTELTTHTPSFAGFGNDTAYAAAWLNMVLTHWNGGETAIWADNAGQIQINSGLTVPVGEWTHIAVSVNQNNVDFYINGELVASATNMPDLFSADDSRFFAVGVNWWDTPYNGLFDELVIYDEPLKAEHVLALYNEQKGETAE